MKGDLSQSPSSDDTVEVIRAGIAKKQSSRGRRVVEKFLMAAIGSIPWVGGLLAAAASIPGDEATAKADDLRTKWLDEHQKKIDQLRHTLEIIIDRLAELGEEIEERIQSPEYLALVRQAFRAWDRAETDDKRRYIANLLTNAAGTRICSDDVIRLFIGWLELFHEAHFAIIREVHQNPGSTRFDIWSGIYGDLPREDSAEADLYRMLIRDLSIGGVIRQTRDVNEAGQFLRRRPRKRRGSASNTVESAFDDSKDYVLTELGKQFVHYTMNEAVTRLGDTLKGA